MTTRVYILLDAVASKSADIIRALRGETGIVTVDLIEGPPDVIIVIEASDRERLAELTVQALSRVEAMTEDLRLLPMMGHSTS